MTIPWGERVQVYRDIVHIITDQLIYMGIYYDVNPQMVGNRLRNTSKTAWDAHLWDV